MIRWRWSLNVSRRRSPICVPHRLGQRLGGDDQRVDGHEPAALAVEGARVALGRPDHSLGAHGPVSRGHSTGRDRRGGRLLVERDPPAYDGVGEAADQSAGMDGRTVGRVGRAAHVGARQDGRGLRGVEQPELVLAPTPLAARHAPRPGPAPTVVASEPGRWCRPWSCGRRCPRPRPTASPRRRCAAWRHGGPGRRSVRSAWPATRARPGRGPSTSRRCGRSRRSRRSRASSTAIRSDGSARAR